MQASNGTELKIHQVPCENGSVSEYYTGVKATAVPLSLVIDSLSSTLRRPVIDQTALGGCFTFDLSWSGYSPPNPAKAVADQLGLE